MSVNGLPGPLRVWARAGGVAVPFAILGMAYARWLPQAGGSSALPRAVAVPILGGVLGLVLLGVLLGWRWPAAGLAVAAAPVGAFAFLASVQYPWPVAVPLTAAVAAPAALRWVARRRPGSLRPLVTLLVVVAVMLAGAWTGASRLYWFFYGPTHPESALRAVPPDRVLWSWAGALTPTSFTVTARLVPGARQARLVVVTDGAAGQPGHGPGFGRPESGQPESGQPRYSPLQAATEDAGRTVRLAVTGLTPGTRYSYLLEVDGRPDRVAHGRIATPPAGPASFRFAFGSCARTGSNGSVFDAIRATEPLFYLNTGDFFYGDVDTDDLGRFRWLYDHTLTAPAQAALYRSTATAYLWDDHDFGPNDTDRHSPSRQAAARVYREAVPHYPLQGAAPDGPIFQAFTVGRVRFLLTDTRSARSPGGAPDDDRKSVLGPAQRAWLEAELRAGRDRYALLVWVSPVPWIEDADPGGDGWGAFGTERRRLADLIAAAGIRNLLMLSGDAHMLAIDDGSHSDYASHSDDATRGGAGFPVFHAGPLDRPGHVKGGPYSVGTRIDGGQFGLVTVDDPGSGPVTVTLSGRTHTGAEVMSYRFTSPRA
jgi:PhoD-like phosphatase